MAFANGSVRHPHPPLNDPSLKPSSITPVPISLAFPRYRFSFPPGGNCAHAPALSDRSLAHHISLHPERSIFAPISAPVSEIIVRSALDARGRRQPLRRYPGPPAQRLLLRMLLLLQRIARPRRLRQNVRTPQIRFPLVGHHLRQTASPPPRRRLQRRPPPAPPRPRRARPALSRAFSGE